MTLKMTVKINKNDYFGEIVKKISEIYTIHPMLHDVRKIIGESAVK